MKKAYYREQALERIARDVITAYDPRLYYGSPAAIPIEDIIEAQGLVLEYQYLRNLYRKKYYPEIFYIALKMQ